nr:MAG TPA: hypothetical protein [Caudoviricetes sp.]
MSIFSNYSTSFSKPKFILSIIIIPCLDKQCNSML